MNKPAIGQLLRRALSGALLVSLLLGASAAMAQGVPHRAIDARDRQAALTAIEARIASRYVFPERRRPIAERLASAAAEGRFDTPDPIAFAARISEDLLAETRDSHLYLRYDPDWFDSAVRASPGEDEASQVAIEVEIARYSNHGLAEMKILPGNIRYLRIEGFAWVEDETGPAYDGAMAFLRGGRAIIIDLRGNGGGWIQASKYLISHFLEADTLIATFLSPDAGPQQYRAADYLPAGRIKGPPVYILIDGDSRSAAEMVAYTFQQYGLGELVGARTQGAANISEDFAVAPGFRLSISTGRTIQPVSGTDWEGVGVSPTIAVEPSRALEAAQLRAIERLLPDTPAGVPRQQLEWSRPALLAALDPVDVDERTLASHAGAYGVLSVRLEEGSLWLDRPDRDPTRLMAMDAGGMFQAVDNESVRVRFAPGSLEVLRPDPAWNTRHSRSD